MSTASFTMSTGPAFPVPLSFPGGTISLHADGTVNGDTNALLRFVEHAEAGIGLGPFWPILWMVVRAIKQDAAIRARGET
jgi:hypothetical protein